MFVFATRTYTFRICIPHGHADLSERAAQRTLSSRKRDCAAQLIRERKIGCIRRHFNYTDQVKVYNRHYCSRGKKYMLEFTSLASSHLHFRTTVIKSCDLWDYVNRTWFNDKVMIRRHLRVPKRTHNSTTTTADFNKTDHICTSVLWNLFASYIIRRKVALLRFGYVLCHDANSE